MTEKYQKITGTIEAIGQSDQTYNLTRYSYFRVLDEDNNVIMLKSVIVANTCSSYVTTGTKAVFYLAKLPVGYYLFALKVDDRKVFDMADTISIEKELSKIQNLYIFFLVMGIFLLFIGIGIFLIIASLWAMKRLSPVRKAVRKDLIKEILEKDGFAVLY